MLKKILLVLVILAPSALYIYIVNRDSDKAETPTQTVPATETAAEKQYQTPEH
ncbi:MULTISPECIES: hypothetical protein [Acinetobacter]|uniref:hypothetical protein n=1 Tax=Acinetobacter TaxID=469 RepID=UPI0014448286|nr:MULTISPECIES: hypothetical protein [Acinetobacter]MBF4521945.1 hypothetical protein [Acinetobacter towneri]MDM1485978.1 hypothetical protein [Acinetobacter towneri]MEB6564112.1 hypothetical protein [Acinetobacter towneri]